MPGQTHTLPVWGSAGKLTALHRAAMNVAVMAPTHTLSISPAALYLAHKQKEPTVNDTLNFLGSQHRLTTGAARQVGTIIWATMTRSYPLHPCFHPPVRAEGAKAARLCLCYRRQLISGLGITELRALMSHKQGGASYNCVSERVAAVRVKATRSYLKHRSSACQSYGGIIRRVGGMSWITRDRT